MTIASPQASTVGDALAHYYVEHGLSTNGGEHDPWFRVHVGPVVIPLPNPPARRRAVFYHDVNHVLTGYNTVFTQGEMIIAGFEIGCGCGPFWVAWLINFFMFGLGLLFAPRATFQAFVRGRHSASVYRRSDRAEMRGMSVDALRTALGIPDGVPAARPADYLVFSGWAIALAAVLLAPVGLALGPVSG